MQKDLEGNIIVTMHSYKEAVPLTVLRFWIIFDRIRIVIWIRLLKTSISK